MEQPREAQHPHSYSAGYVYLITRAKMLHLFLQQHNWKVQPLISAHHSVGNTYFIIPTEQDSVLI